MGGLCRGNLSSAARCRSKRSSSHKDARHIRRPTGGPPIPACWAGRVTLHHGSAPASYPRKRTYTKTTDRASSPHAKQGAPEEDRLLEEAAVPRGRPASCKAVPRRLFTSVDICS